MKILYKVFLYFFAVTMLLILALSLSAVLQTKDALFCLLGLLILCALVLWGLRKGKKFFTDRRCLMFALFCLGILLCVQFIYCSKNVFIPLKGDYEAIYTAVKEVVLYGKLTDSNLYFLHHAHQSFSMLIYSIFNYVVTKAGSIQPINVLATTFLNSILCCFGGLLLYYGTKRVLNARSALFTVLLFCLHNSYIASNVYIYCHALSVFFVCAVLFFFSYAATAKTKKAECWMFFFWGASIAVAKSVEGIITLSLIAALIYCLLTSKTIRMFFLRTALLIGGFAVALLMISASYRVLGIIDYTNAENEAFPYTHWIMIGLNDDGSYSEDDYQAMVHAETKEEKWEYAASQIKQRLKNKDFQELYELGKLKESKMWVGSQYGQNLGGLNYAYNIAYKFLLYAGVSVGLIRCFIMDKKRKESIDLNAFGFIWIFGIFLFALIWESSMIYLFSSMPLLIIMAGIGTAQTWLSEKSNSLV